jgi:signal transduction histidine kinase
VLREALALRRMRWLMIGPLVIVIALLAGATVASVEVMSAVRAYVHGESRWSKGQKDALYHLERYLVSRDPADHRRFEEALAAPLGDRAARLALEQQPPDLELARRGFLAGGNHPDDIEGMVQLFLRFRRVSFMADAIDIWAQGDADIQELSVLAARLHERVVAGDTGSPELRNLTARLPGLNARLTDLEQRFSSTLGEASRITKRLMTGLTLLLAVGLTLAALAFTRAMLRRQARTEHALVEVNERWALAADAAGLGLFDWNLDTQRAALDARGAALHGLPAQPVEVEVGPMTDAYIHPDDLLLVRNAMTSALTQPGPLQLRYRVRAGDTLTGGERHLEAIARVRRDEGGASVRMVGTLRDVTAEIHAARLRLEKEAAERASLAKSEFLSRVSHELRTPLNAVLGFSELLLTDPRDPLTPGQRLRLQHVTDAGRNLLSLINDILDLSHLDQAAHPLQLEPLPLAPLLNTSLAPFEPMAHAQSVRLTLAPPPPALAVMADARRLEQVLANLLSNAIKYNRHGGEVHVACERRADEACITVRDSGPGLRPEQLAQLFQPFNRLGAEYTKVPGSGLGLVIVQQLLKRMGGRLEFSSVPDEGSCARVFLRATGADGLRPPPQPSDAGAQAAAGT